MFIIAIVCLLIVAVCGYVVFYYISSAEQARIEQARVTPSPTPVPDRPETAYGVAMQKKCFDGFQGFIKNNGEDYSKCLVDFEFNDEYCGGFDPETQALSDENVIVILDSSGSMAEKTYLEEKIDVAKKAVSDFLTQMPQTVNTGLVVYGHKGSNSTADKSLSCNGIEEVVKLGTNNNSKVIAAINSFSPRGWTPIAGSLDFAKDIFSQKNPNDKNYLILVSDGVESCDGDPLVAANNLRLAIPGVKLSIIGFDTDHTTREFLTKIAAMGGGSYVDAYGSADMADAFNKQLLLIKKDCVSVTITKMSLRYNENNLGNLNCWLAASQKELDVFNTSITQEFADAECSQEVSDAIVARQTEFWYKRRDIEDENDVIYKKIEADLNNKLKALGD